MELELSVCTERNHLDIKEDGACLHRALMDLNEKLLHGEKEREREK